MTSVLGVDVGGTKVAVGPVDRDGTELAPTLVEPTRTEDQASFLAGLEASLRRALAAFERFEPRAFGLACAGTVDSERGVVMASPNLPLVDAPLAFRARKGAGAAGGARERRERRGTRRSDHRGGGGAATCGHAHSRDGRGRWALARRPRVPGGATAEAGSSVTSSCGPAGCRARAGRTVVWRCTPRDGRWSAMRRPGPAIPSADPSGELTALQEQGRLTGGAVAELAMAGDKAASGRGATSWRAGWGSGW